MRYHVLRFDIWLCLAIGFLVGMGVGKLTRIYMVEQYKDYEKEHVVEKNEVGGIADEIIFRVQNIEEMFQHDKFTVVSPGIEYKNKGSGYYHNFYLHALTLPSGEIVAARINSDSVVHTGSSIYTGDSILPVCKIEYADLTDHSTFLGQIEYSRPLDRHDFYLDCVGEASIMNEESFIEVPVLLAQLITIVIVFPIVHMIGSKNGLFPYIISPKH